MHNNQQSNVGNVHTSHHRLERDAARKIAANVPRTNVLRFSLVRQILWGGIDGKAYGPVKALSGGGQSGTHDQSLKVRDWDPHKKKISDKAGHRGGALVPGWWIILPERLAKGTQSSYVQWGAAPTSNPLRIVPYELDSSYRGGNRGSFYIHGTGGKGSDGCILIDPASRHALVSALGTSAGAWLYAYISGTELKDVLELTSRVNRTA